MTFAPTAEQVLIFSKVRETKRNLQVVARAGAGKTTTIVGICDQVPNIDALCIAFNKKIADELKTRLPSSAEAATLHSLGNRAIKDLLGKWPKLDTKKCYNLLRSAIDQLDPTFHEEAFEDLSETLRFISGAKADGYLPRGTNNHARALYSDPDYFQQLDPVPSDLQQHLITEVLRASFKEAMAGTIDFDDMVYIPALMPCTFRRRELVMVDEAQDLSILNHILLSKIAKGARLIAVGDPCQAIYGFRGADEDSMEKLRISFEMEELYLTICFRSAEEIVKNARWRAPDMQWRPGAPSGSVKNLSAWSSADLQDGDAIICRNNAPLFSLAMKLLQDGIRPELSTGDMTKGLLAIFKKLGKRQTPVLEAESRLIEWRQQNQSRYKSKDRLADTVAVIQLFLDRAKTLGEAMDNFEQLLAQAGRIKLMTGHKSKGLEFNRVFFLDSHLCRAKGQDANIRYVIETRAREHLFYVASETYGAEAPE